MDAIARLARRGTVRMGANILNEYKCSMQKVEI
jgi:hypothetical protein